MGCVSFRPCLVANGKTSSLFAVLQMSLRDAWTRYVTLGGPLSAIEMPFVGEPIYIYIPITHFTFVPFPQPNRDQNRNSSYPQRFQAMFNDSSRKILNLSGLKTLRSWIVTFPSTPLNSTLLPRHSLPLSANGEILLESMRVCVRIWDFLPSLVLNSTKRHVSQTVQSSSRTQSTVSAAPFDQRHRRMQSSSLPQTAGRVAASGRCRRKSGGGWPRRGG